MSDLITVSICLTDIPKDKIKVSDKNGKKYLNICVARRREPDQFDQTHTVYVSQTKEEREWKREKQFIGSGKEFFFTPTDTTPASVETMPAATDEDMDDLPF